GVTKPSIVSPGYVIEVANGKKEEVDRIICDCNLELGNSLFTIDMIPLGHGSFDVIVGMDWLSKNKAEIVCHKKVVRISLEGGEVLRAQRERTLGGMERILKKKAKNDQNRARNGKDKVKSKSKVSHMKKIQLEGLKLPNLKLYYKSKRQGSKLQTGQSLQ
ncbi:reverse transcriptase domain-containing protein, partial [Tanacetum coccineum]